MLILEKKKKIEGCLRHKQKLAARERDVTIKKMLSEVKSEIILIVGEVKGDNRGPGLLYIRGEWRCRVIKRSEVERYSYRKVLKSKQTVRSSS